MLKKYRNNALKFTLVLMTGLSTLNQTASANWLEQGTDLLKSLQTNNTDSSSKTNSSLPANLSNEELQKAFKQALTKGTETIVGQLSAMDGFNADPKIHIPLPKNLQKVQSTMEKFGMGKYMDEVETKLNRAAEAATPEAKAIFIDAIKNLSFEDVQKIYSGPKDSATQLLRDKTSTKIKTKMEPIIGSSLNEVGAIKAYNKAIKKYENIPFMPDVKTDLTNHVVDKGLEGMFYYIAQEEAAIRQDPVKQTTELLKKVFGN